MNLKNKKYMKTILSKFAIAVTAISIMLTSCKKDFKEDKLPRNALSAASVDPSYTEDDITAFVTLVTDLTNKANTNLFIDPTEAITKMEATLNYVFSDVDTAMVSQETVSYPFTLTTTSDGVTIGDLSTTAIAINTFIGNQLNANAGSGFTNRIVNTSIDPDGSGGYTLNVTVGKAYQIVPDYSPASVTDGTHPWYMNGDNDLNGNSVPNCSGSVEGVASILRTQGAAWMSQVTATRINQNVPAGYVAYLDKSINILYVPNTTPARANIEYTDVATTAGTMPTSVLYVNPNSTPYYAQVSPIFAGDKTICGTGTSARFASYITVLVTDAYLNDQSVIIENHYNYCMPQEYINYYISKVQDIFDALKPNAECFPLLDETATTTPTREPDFNVKDNLWDYSPGHIWFDVGVGVVHRGWNLDESHPPYNFQRTYINHTYYYKYTVRKLKKVATWPWFADLWWLNKNVSW